MPSSYCLTITFLDRIALLVFEHADIASTCGKRAPTAILFEECAAKLLPSLRSLCLWLFRWLPILAVYNGIWTHWYLRSLIDIVEHEWKEANHLLGVMLAQDSARAAKKLRSIRRFGKVALAWINEDWALPCMKWSMFRMWGCC